MGWTKVCETARSGIWVLKGNARTRVLPANLDHLRVGWRSRGTYETAWVTPGHDCLCPYQCGHVAAVRPQTDNAIWDGVVGKWGRVAPPLVALVCKRECAHGSELEPVRRSKIMHPLAQRQRTLVRATESMSSGHSVEFQVRLASSDVPSSIPLDHGDLLIMDGSAQSEYAQRTVSGLQGSSG